MTDIRKFMNLFESTLIQEDYYQRVRDTVKAITSADMASEPELMAMKPVELIYHFAKLGNVVEIGMNDRARKEFIKDVASELKAAGFKHRRKVARDPSARTYRVLGRSGERVKVTQEEIQKLGMKMMEFAGEVFPDGDPHDLLISYFKEQGWDMHDAFARLVPLAAKKVLGTKDYNNYLADLWDDAYGDAKHDAQNRESHLYNAMGGDQAVNPWK